MKDITKLEKRSKKIKYNFENIPLEEYRLLRRKYIISAILRVLFGIVGLVFSVVIMATIDW